MVVKIYLHLYIRHILYRSNEKYISFLLANVYSLSLFQKTKDTTKELQYHSITKTRMSKHGKSIKLLWHQNSNNSTKLRYYSPTKEWLEFPWTKQSTEFNLFVDGKNKLVDGFPRYCCTAGNNSLKLWSRNWQYIGSFFFPTCPTKFIVNSVYSADWINTKGPFTRQ